MALSSLGVSISPIMILRSQGGSSFRPPDLRDFDLKPNRVSTWPNMAERNALFAGMTLDQIIADIKQAKPGARAPSGGIERKPQG
jgi:hypothetical protein